MADPVVMPPLPKCGCAFCRRRRAELELAAQLDREMHHGEQGDYSIEASLWSFAGAPVPVRSRQQARP